jgi:hypothetical protein
VQRVRAALLDDLSTAESRCTGCGSCDSSGRRAETGCPQTSNGSNALNFVARDRG